jgi:hypothetical protein
MEIKIYLSQNKKTKDTQPDVRLAQITEDGRFVDIGALWKSKDPTKKYYTGRLKVEAIETEPAEVKDEELEKVEKEFEKAEKPKVEYPERVDEPAF